MSRYAHLAFTEPVQRFQAEQGSRVAGRLMSNGDPGSDPLGAVEAEFIHQRDGCYVASVGATGWPYMQFKGGPPGFLHVLDERTLAYADVRGNRQYITNGNLSADDRVAMFFMDYVRQARLKLFGHASTRPLDADEALTERLCAVRTEGRVERLVIIRVEGLSWNCTQHIPQRFSWAELSEVSARISQVRQENDQLVAENRALRRRLALLDGVQPPER